MTSQEEHDFKLRKNLYNAACNYFRVINIEYSSFDMVMEVSQELEDAADAWAERNINEN